MDEILNLIESVSEDFPSYSSSKHQYQTTPGKSTCERPCKHTKNYFYITLSVMIGELRMLLKSKFISPKL